MILKRHRKRVMSTGDRPLRVLFLTNIPAPYRVSFFNELAKSCDLTVLYERRRASDRHVEWSTTSTPQYREVYLPGFPVGADKAFSPAVLQHLNRSRYDVIVLGGYATPTGILAIGYLATRRIPFVLNADGGLVSPESHLRSLAKRTLISRATAWLSTGQTTSRYLEHYGAERDRIFIYPFSSVRAVNVVAAETTDETRRCLRAALGIDEPKSVLAVGQFIHRKGFDVLIRAAKQLPADVGIYIVGGEPTREYVDLRDSLGLRNVHFVGFLGGAELRDYYDAADLFVLPTRRDVWGLVINEAMARGLPIVTTDQCVAGLEMVENETNGYLVPSEDVDALARAMNQILSNVGLRERFASGSREHARDYTIETMAARHLDIFDELRPESRSG